MHKQKQYKDINIMNWEEKSKKQTKMNVALIKMLQDRNKQLEWAKEFASKFVRPLLMGSDIKEDLDNEFFIQIKLDQRLRAIEWLESVK